MAKFTKKKVLEGLGDLIADAGGLSGVNTVCLTIDGQKRCLPRQYGKGVARSMSGKRTTVAHPKRKFGQGRGTSPMAQAADLCRSEVATNDKGKFPVSTWRECIGKNIKQFAAGAAPKKAKKAKKSKKG